MNANGLRFLTVGALLLLGCSSTAMGATECCADAWWPDVKVGAGSYATNRQLIDCPPSGAKVTYVEVWADVDPGWTSCDQIRVYLLNDGETKQIQLPYHSTQYERCWFHGEFSTQFDGLAARGYWKLRVYNGSSVWAVTLYSWNFSALCWDGPTISVTPSKLDFGRVSPGNTVAQQFVVKNLGYGTLSGGASGLDSPFSFEDDHSYSLEYGQSEEITVYFTPTGEGSFSDTAILSGGGGAALPVSGIGEGQSIIYVEPSELDFGSVRIGENPPSKSFIVTNVGYGTLSGSAGGLEAPFSFETDHSYSLGHGQSEEITVYFTPTGEGSFSDTASFSGGGGATRPVRGTSYGDPVISVEPSALHFGSVVVGSKASKSFVVTNVGYGTLSGSASGLGSPFSFIGPTNYSLTRSKQTTIVVEFAPQFAQYFEDIVNFSGGGNYDGHVDGTGVPSGGSLKVAISPPEAVTAGAQWRVDGGAWQNSGVTVSGLSVGNHQVSFKDDVPGWTKPGDQSVSIVANQTTSASGQYTPIGDTGSLKVAISPPEAATAGAQWRVDGGAWQNSGVTVSGLSVGNHQVSFNDVDGWIAPSATITDVIANQTAEISGTYLSQECSLRVLSQGLPQSLAPDPVVGLVKRGTAATIFPREYYDYRFVRWSGDASGSDDPLTVVMDGDKTITAVYEQCPIEKTLCGQGVPVCGLSTLVLIGFMRLRSRRVS